MSNVSHRGAASPSGPGLYPASGINFLQNGVGALERTMLAKAQERVSIRDFAADGIVTNWRSAFVAAHTYLVSVGGGTLHFPASEDRYEIDNTGSSALEVDDSIVIQGAGFRASVIANISTDGTDLFNPVGGSFKFGFVLKDIKLESDASAGHIINPDTDAGVANGYWQGVYAHQRNPNKSVWHQAITQRGLFFYTFRDCRLESGTQGTPSLVPCIDIDGVDNSFSSVWFENCRFQCNHSYSVFFRVTNSAGGNPLKQVVIRDCASEQCRAGLILAEGSIDFTIDSLVLFDTVSPFIGDYIKFRTGSGGLGNEQPTVRNYLRLSGTLEGVAGSILSVSSLTQVAGVATCTTSTAHGYATGDNVELSGAVPSSYTGEKTITVTGANTFTFSVSAGAASPATGTIICIRLGKAVASLSHAAGTATCNTTQAHNLAVGMRAYVSGADQSGYNGRVTVLTVPDSDTFTYAVDPGTASPATGSVTADIAAMDVAFGPDDSRIHIENILGAVNDSEVDLNNSSSMVLGRNTSSMFYRLPVNTSTAVTIGSGAAVETSTVTTNNIGARTSGGNITATSMIAATLGVEFGGNSSITDMRVASQALDFGSVAANGGTLELDITISGIGSTWRAVANPQSNVPAGLIPSVRTLTDTVRIRMTNVTAAPIDPGSITFVVTAWKQ